MEPISRRQFLYLVSSSLCLLFPYSFVLASSRENNPKKGALYPITIAVLKAAYVAEMSAYRHYGEYLKKAVDEGYPNIAYLFRSFGVSEKIHADNYKKILESFGLSVEKPTFDISLGDTKANLRNAAEKELMKITKTYPEFLAQLKDESYDQAVINCMYSWKSHRQHEEKIAQIQRYSKFFFGSVARKIEGMKLDFHVCGICGSTLDEPPEIPCVICNYPISYYKRVVRPV
jgi:rubrerythrin